MLGDGCWVLSLYKTILLKEIIPCMWINLILLASRLVFGLTFASHGLDKLQHFSETAAHFPAPFGLSGEVAVGLSIFGELVCGLAFVFGFLTRLALLPMIFTMIVAFTVFNMSFNFFN